MRFFTLHKSIYSRTLRTLVASVVVLFLFFGFLFYWLLTYTNRNQVKEHLKSQAEAVCERLSTSMDADHLSLTSYAEEGYISFAARSNRSLVWLVNSQGEIIAYSGVPKSTNDYLRNADARARLLLADKYLNHDNNRRAKVVNQFSELLPTDTGWISVSCPMTSNNGVYAGELLIHYPTSNDFNQSKSIYATFILALLVTLVLSLLVFSLVTSYITKPINRMVGVATKVSQGELHERVILPGQTEPEYLGQISSNTKQANAEIQLLARSLNTMIEKWSKAEEHRREFLASVSHDLRSPLTSIRGFLEGIKDGIIPQAKQQHYLDIVYQETGRILNLVRSLLEISAWEEPDRIQLLDFDVLALLQGVIQSLEPQLEERSLAYLDETGLGKDKIMVNADQQAIHRVLVNIIGNAIRYTKPNGHIAITLRLVGSKLAVVIDDDGEGIPEAEREHIFERFYKVDKSRHAQGSGLGLYIVRTLLQLHNERVEVGESPAGGARFSFTLALTENKSDTKEELTKTE